MFGGTRSSCSMLSEGISVNQEVQNYFDEKLLDPSSDPLLYWRKKAIEFPILSQLVQRYLAFPASSGGIERVFSVSGSLERGDPVLKLKL